MLFILLLAPFSTLLQLLPFATTTLASIPNDHDHNQTQNPNHYQNVSNSNPGFNLTHSPYPRPPTNLTNPNSNTSLPLSIHTPHDPDPPLKALYVTALATMPCTPYPGREDADYPKPFTIPGAERNVTFEELKPRPVLTREGERLAQRTGELVCLNGKYRAETRHWRFWESFGNEVGEIGDMGGMDLDFEGREVSFVEAVVVTGLIVLGRKEVVWVERNL